MKYCFSFIDEDQFGCEVCKKIFKNYSSYREHLLTEDHIPSTNSEESPELMPCQFCSKLFPNKRRLMKHANKYHRDVIQLYQCDVCDFKSSKEMSFRKHQQLHTKKKEFICEKCGDSFYTKNALQDHLNCVHNEERNFSCEKCGHTFKSLSVLNRHMLCHNKERLYKCHCGQSYKFSGNLNRHQLLAHGKKTKLKQVKRLVTDEVANLTSKISKSKKKLESKEKQQIDNTATICKHIEGDANVLLPFQQVLSQGNLLLPAGQSETQMLQVACHNLIFCPELVFPIAALHEVDSLLQSEDSLKTTDTNETNDCGTQNIFVQHLSDTDGSTFLDNESLIHPPIEPSVVATFDDSTLNSVDQSNNQPHQTALLVQPSFYNMHYLDN